MIQVGKPVKGNQFIGREKEIKEMLQYLQFGQSVVIIAPRRFGKTSLILEVKRQLEKQGLYTGYIDIFEYSELSNLSRGIIGEVLDNHQLKKAFTQAKGSITKMLQNLKLKAVLHDFEFLFGLQDESQEDWDTFHHAVDFIDDFPHSNNSKMVFSFDEFGDILKFDSNKKIIKLLRSKIQSQEDTAYIFCGSYESVMASMFVSSKSPFYRLAKIIELSYLPFAEVKKYMLSNLKSNKIPIDENLIDQTIDFLKGHPYYCQLALQQLYLYYLSKKKAPKLYELIDLLMYSDISYLEKIWEDLSSNKEYVFILTHLTMHAQGIYGMASKKGINAARALKKLEGMGYIYKKDKEYHFYDPIFEYWIGKQLQF